MHRIANLTKHLRRSSCEQAQRPSEEAVVVIGGTLLDVQVLQFYIEELPKVHAPLCINQPTRQATELNKLE